ncbi:MAG: 2-isopropylmalate synthase [Rhodothermales bacterium]
MRKASNGSGRVIIFDTTLRDGEQSPGASMSLGEKVEIAEQLERLGVDVIEAGFPISSPAQFAAVEAVAAAVSNPVICALARAVPGDVESAASALANAKKKRIHTFIATSDIHIASKFDHARYGATIEEKRKTIMRMAVEAVQLARRFTDDVEFSTEDAGRTDHGFLCEVIRAAVEAGATVVNIPDTTGYCLPYEYARMFELARTQCGVSDDVILSTHCHDDLGLAVANSLAGVKAGARQIECTINGIGERAGNASLEEVVMALRVRQSEFGLDTGINAELLTESSHLVSLYSGCVVQPNKAIVGRNAFSHEAGIHQHGVLKSRETYEIMRAEDVGQKVQSIRLGRHSGRHGFFARLKDLGISVNGKNREELYNRFVALADKKREVFDDDLVRLVNREKDAGEQTLFTLEELNVNVGSTHAPEAYVAVRHKGSGFLTERKATGDGPVDALFRAIDRAVGESHRLMNYSIRSVSEGADAVGEVSVVIAHGGKSFAGAASHTDVLQASAGAYLAALNRLAWYLSHEGLESVQFINEGIMNSFDSAS